ncbi:accessory factor UbiK family protein [Halomonas sp. TRM85114]|uniref:accessory factor UbiK family protein n=1 Tax=Halomonas jincaotanensis TaxID=2810616 RepID=UPI001BD5A7C7|nr:accessory factor UbiK family protein [Halomonas jincaotanensis]
MVSHDRISRLAQQIGDRLQGASRAPEEMQKGIQQVVRGAVDRLELVSREDFDILMDVLQRTRGRIEALEKQVAELEKAVQGNPSTTTAQGTETDWTATGATAGEGVAKKAADKPSQASPTPDVTADEPGAKGPSTPGHSALDNEPRDDKRNP